ncbi:MAG: methyl-accepting chemotaxis protein [Treponemataceae bacterium]|nr:methyl-accepting chemotaxis protein [Treponemataceae bacterium]
MKKRKISFQIILRISAIILIICTTLSLVSVVLFKKVLTEQVMSSMIKSRDDGAKLIEMAISSYIKEVDAVAQRYDIRSMDWNIQKPVLQSEAKRIGFECFQVSDISGNAITTRNESLNIGGYSYFGQVLAGESCISDVSYEERFKKMVVVVNSPIRNENGEIIGVLSGVADASFTNDIVNSIDLDYDGEVFVINDAGYKMAGVDFIGKKALENNIFDKNYGPDTGFGQYRQLQIKMIQGGSDLEQFYMNGRDYFLAYVTISNGWHLGIIQDRNQAMAIIYELLTIMLIVGFVAIVIGIISGLLISLKLRPLKKLSLSITEIASGKADLTQRIKVESKNEIGEVVDGFNTFTGKLQSIMTVMKESKESLVNVGKDLNLNTEKTLHSINDIFEKIQKIGVETTNQSNSVSETASAVNEISSNIGSLEKMIDVQARTVENASSAVEEMIANIASVNSSVAKMAESFKVLETKAKNGLEKQDDVSNKIELVGQESAMLSTANKTIQNIASQTNLLAMNAAIEAAHAGEAGKGFSVVADEIRKLSETSTVQSKTISEQLKKIQESIQQIIVASSETKVAFNEVSDEIKKTDVLVSEIAESMEQQTIGSKSINESLHEMNDSTDEVIQAVNEMSVGSKSILQEVHSLQNATFSVRESMEGVKLSAEEIKTTGQGLSDISNLMNNSINDIGSQVDQFQV